MGFACGSSDVAGVREADAGADASTDADSIPDTAIDVCSFHPVPMTTVYQCDAAAPGARGCLGIEPVSTIVYPLGCRLMLPRQSGMHCGGLDCSCENDIGSDGGTIWSCPD
jgi:hypothetical protein